MKSKAEEIENIIIEHYKSDDENLTNCAYKIVELFNQSKPLPGDKELLKEAYDYGNENSIEPNSISNVDEQFEVWYDENIERLIKPLPSDEEIDEKIDKSLIAQGYHPTRVRNPMLGEERKLAFDLAKWMRDNYQPQIDFNEFKDAKNAPTFNEWLAKYFEPAKVSKTYKDKTKLTEHTERYLYKKYARAYRLSV